MVKTFLRRAYTSFATNIIDVPTRLLSFMLLLLLIFLPLIFVPLGQLGSYIIYTLTLANILAIFAASWDLLVGRAGQISLGHALFFAIGAYASALLEKFAGLPPWVTVPIAMLVGVLVALLVGFPCLRVKGPYLALVTMAFPLIALNIVLYSRFSPITGGESGVTAASFFPFLDINQQGIAEYFLTLILLLVSGILLYKIANSKTGIVFVSILDDELGSKACGINVTRYKLLALAVSALFAALAGGLHAHFILLAGPATLALNYSFLPIIMTMLGGIGTIYGPIAAAYILQILDRYVLSIPVRVPDEWHLLIFVFVVVIIVIKWPRGIARFVTDKLDDLQKTRELEERGKHIWKTYRKKKKKQPIHEG